MSIHRCYQCYHLLDDINVPCPKCLSCWFGHDIDVLAEHNRLRALNAELVKALTMLSNEAACWSACDLAFVGGWTNAHLLQERVKQARAAIAKAKETV